MSVCYLYVCEWVCYQHVCVSVCVISMCVSVCVIIMCVFLVRIINQYGEKKMSCLEMGQTQTSAGFPEGLLV